MTEKRKFKSGTILTDGESLIKIGYALNPNWSANNNHGRKETEYQDCRTYPSDLYVNNILTIKKKYGNSIPGLWFQQGYHLEKFKPIDIKLINKKLLNHEQ